MPIVQVYVFMLGKNLHTEVYCSLLAVMIEFTQVQFRVHASSVRADFMF